MVSKAIFQLPYLKSIHLDALSGQENSLESVDLFKTSMSSIPTRIIRFLKKIKSFGIYDSEEVEVVAEDAFEMFSGVKTLTEISFPGNSISSLRKGAFSHLVNLNKLHLQDNKLRNVNIDSLPSKFNGPARINLA